MNNNKSYTGIDYFRFLAAFLIIAIHTSPLLSYSQTADFIFTRIIARVAVPFFFMTSGFFLISRYSYNNDKLKSFIKKTAVIYGISMIIYIPLNIYMGYFKMDNLLPNLIKDIFFDGTIYHLWYLPASILGAVIAWFAVKRLGFKKAMVVTLILYIVGMFGDSYYGISDKVQFLKNAYVYIFQVSDYTRNGIFFAPVFFVMGGFIADKSYRISLKGNVIGFLASFLFMVLEGMILHISALQRHDSMYLMLLPCMYFLFNSLTFLRGKRNVLLRTSALVIYIIHPIIIVALRMFAKIIDMQGLLIENSLVNYLAVSVISVVVSMVCAIAVKKTNKHSHLKERAWIELDTKNLKHNIKELNRAMPENCSLMAVVKANAYGHGAFQISALANRFGVRSFAVATIDEGISLRKYGIKGEILILGYTNPVRAKELRKYDLMQTLIDYDYAVKLNEQGCSVKAHIKIDTGMHRFGIDSKNVIAVSAVFSMRNIRICGIYTHFCVSDSLDTEDISYTNAQISDFYMLIDKLRESEVEIPKIHIQSSYGLLNYPELKCDYVRAGVALYGVLSSRNDKTKLNLDLRPVLSLKSQVILVRDVRGGENVGYGRKFIAEQDSRIAIVSIGYGDGLPRNLSCINTHVLVNGQQADIVGRVCMDVIAIDITNIEGVAVGDIVTLIGKNGSNELPAAYVADQSETITNEILSRMSTRLNVVVF